MDSDIMTIREVAEYLKLTEKTAYRHAADGDWSFCFLITLESKWYLV